jgi:2-polyprenyl-6-methoxyphenol hydroxylase-like FAD-dependent oxidoreductase
METKPFKVIIVGGSISGLSLALMLEKNGIDFVVLEGYKSIAPQVGASIGVLANGLRILDQLDCCQSVLDKAEYSVDKVCFRDSQGKLIWKIEGFDKDVTERFVALCNKSPDSDGAIAH